MKWLRNRKCTYSSIESGRCREHCVFKTPNVFNLILFYLLQRPATGPPPEGMSACNNCGRHFNTDRIEKHEVICKKTTTKKRKIFDATKHRVKVFHSIA